MSARFIRRPPRPSSISWPSSASNFMPSITSARWARAQKTKAASLSRITGPRAATAARNVSQA